MNNKIKFYIFIITIILAILPSCKNQCQILEERIKICKENIDCNNNDLICTEVDNAQSLIKTINSKITEGTTDKNDIENACSLSLNKINFNDCIDAQNRQNGDWQDIKYLMAYFGLEGAIDKVNTTIKFVTNTNTDTDVKCGSKILKEYSDIQHYQETIKFIMLKTFSEVISLIQLNPNSDSNIFIGKDYINNENSQCDFNSNNRFNINYNNYDYIFCSESSGWLSETNVTKSNCALTRQEIFLINWKNIYFVDWCLNNFKNSYTNCKEDGNTYDCIEAAHNECYSLRENFFCNSTYQQCSSDCLASGIRNCKETCKNNFLACKENITQNNNCKIRCQIDKCSSKTDSNYFYECLESTNEDNKKNTYSCCNCENLCTQKCKDNTSSDTCKSCRSQCITNCTQNNQIDISCYKDNITKIENCYHDKINENQEQEFTTCINDNDEICNNSCNYDSCIYSCLDENCKDVECFERSSQENDFFDKKSCNQYSCYYSCQKQCQTIEIDNDTSKIMTVYREVDDNEIAGSNCDQTEVFTMDEANNKYYNYCVIEYSISNY